MKPGTHKWLRPFEAVARLVTYAFLLWLWWVGLRSIKPEDDDVRDVSTMAIYLGLTIVLVSLGLALLAFTR